MNALRLSCCAVIAGSIVYLLIPFGDWKPVKSISGTANTSNLASFMMSKHADDLRRVPLFQTDADSNGLIAPGRVILFGVVQGRQNRALLGAPDGKPVWLTEGETAHGLTLTKVRPSAVVLAGPDGASEIRLFGSSARPDPASTRSTDRDP
jgi:hypothetical protein